MKKIILAALTIVAMVGCQKRIDTITEPSDVKATFTGSQVDVLTSNWEENDKVGIFMYEHGTTSTALETNVCYRIDSEGVLTELADSIFYPTDNSVDFYAYYPYQSDMDGTTYLADLADQSDAGNIDLVTSSIENVNMSSTTQSFEFNHALSMVELKLSPKHDTLSLEGVVVTLEGVNSKASFDILTGEMIDGSTSGSDRTIELLCIESEANENGYVDNATATAIVLPETTSNGAKIAITFPNGKSLSTLFESQPFTAGIKRTYNVTVGSNFVYFDIFSITPWSYHENEEETEYKAEDVTDNQ